MCLQVEHKAKLLDFVKMCIFFLITFAATVVGVPQQCTVFCQSSSPKGIWLPWCDCSAKPPESVNAAPDASSFLRSSEYEATDIYYEPDETQFKFQTKLHFKHPFYIKNPTPKLRLKTPKRELNNIQLIDTSISHGTPLYLDIIVEDGVESRDTKELKDLELTEKSLMECLDLHIVVFLRRGVNTIRSELVQHENLKKYETMSNADVIMAIKSKCNKSLEMVNRSLQRIQKAQPKKKGLPPSIAAHLDNSPSSSLVNINTDSPFSSDENKSFDEHSNGSEKLKLNLLETNPHMNNVKIDHETVTLGDILDLEATTINESDSDKSISQSKLVSTRSTMNSSNSGVFDYVSLPEIKDVAQDNRQNSGKKETTDNVTFSSTNNGVTEPYWLTEFPNILIDGRENTSLSSSEMNVIDKTYRKKYYNQSQISQSASRNITTELNIQKYSTEDAAKELNSASKITHITNTPKLERGNEEALTDYPTTSSINHESSLASQSFYARIENVSKDNNYDQKSSYVSEKVKERRIYNESEILIPKIQTKELANGTVFTTIQGHEILPNMDFIMNNDDKTYEDSITAENAHLSSRRTFDSGKNQMTPETGFSGKLYFIFDKALIPARFFQNSDGIFSLGVDGNSMCQNLLKTHESRFLSKLCKSINKDEYDELPSATSDNVNDIRK